MTVNRRRAWRSTVLLAQIHGKPSCIMHFCVSSHAALLSIQPHLMDGVSNLPYTNNSVITLCALLWYKTWSMLCLSQGLSLQKISSKSVYSFLSYPVYRQKNRPDRETSSTLSVKDKVGHSALESVGGCSSPFYRPWARRWRTTNVCDAWPVWPQTYGYLPSQKASLPVGWYQIILHSDRGTCVLTTCPGL